MARTKEEIATHLKAVKKAVTKSGVSLAGLVEKTGLDAPVVTHALSSLRMSGAVTKTGKTRTTTYHAAS